MGYLKAAMYGGVVATPHTHSTTSAPTVVLWIVDDFAFVGKLLVPTATTP